MKNRLIKSLVAVLLFAGVMTAALVLTPSSEVDAATLIWSDEFNGNSLDQSKWTYDWGTANWGWGNNEQQYYTTRTENVSVYDGALHITARNEAYGGMNYTSGRIHTSGKFDFKYGTVEARVALPSANGMWPALWMLGKNHPQVGWPYCGEIDIIEAINAENKVYGTNHWDSGGHASYGNSSSTFDITQYHVYKMEWDQDYIRMFVDGNKYHEILISGSTGGTEEFHQNFYFILNVAVGGQWPGYNIDAGAMPKTMLVDYLRVYQGSGSTSGENNQTTTAKPNNTTVTTQTAGGSSSNVSGTKVAVANVSCSSAEGNDYIANFAVDGNLGTRWSSNFADNNYLQLDLGAKKKINQVVVNWEAAYAKAYYITISKDGKKWETVYSQNNGVGGVEVARFNEKEARYIKIQGVTRATEYGYSIWEVEVYSGASTNTTTTTAAQPNNTTTTTKATTTQSAGNTVTVDKLTLVGSEFYNGRYIKLKVQAPNLGYATAGSFSYSIKVDGAKNAAIHETYWDLNGYEIIIINLNENYKSGKVYKVKTTAVYGNAKYENTFNLSI